MPRKYNKKSEYWNNLSKLPVQDVAKLETSDKEFPDITPAFDDSDHFSAIAACGGGYSTTHRDSRSPDIIPTDAYKNIDSGLLPYELNNGHIGISRAIVLSMKAYANVAIVRNAIEGAVEFSTAPVHVKTPNQSVKDFFLEWFNRINLNSFTSQFFREYYRSGNVFIYKFLGKFSEDQFGKMKSVFGAKDNKIPLRYIILNPAQVFLQGGISYSANTWTKILSTYELQRLKDPTTPEDKEIFNSLPDNVKKQIKAGAGYSGIYIPLDPKRLSYVFYKKQDYEPLATPMVFPVLNDIEYKLDLKKMDMGLARTIEHVILLITNGAKKDEGGINPSNIERLQNIFRNQTLGRVLVADYTTKGEWLIPDISAILGPDKYKQVESDIREGLQSIMGGADEKFANAQIKAKVFIERMREGQRIFLNNFLLPEIKQVCINMGFRNVPEIEFEQIDLSDTSVMSRVYVQMAQLGLLTADELFLALKSGLLPDKESSIINQKEYKKQRADELFTPLLGGEKKEENGRPAGTGSPQTTKKVSPIGTSKADYKFGTKKLGELVIKADALKEQIGAALKKKYKIKKADSFTDSQLYVVEAVAKSIISNELPEKWSESVASYIEEPKEISQKVGDEIDEISLKFDTSTWDATILRHAKM